MPEEAIWFTYVWKTWYLWSFVLHALLLPISVATPGNMQDALIFQKKNNCARKPPHIYLMDHWNSLFCWGKISVRKLTDSLQLHINFVSSATKIQLQNSYYEVFCNPPAFPLSQRTQGPLSFWEYNKFLVLWHCLSCSKCSTKHDLIDPIRLPYIELCPLQNCSSSPETGFHHGTVGLILLPKHCVSLE